MCADIYTKAFTDVNKWNEVRDLIGVFDTKTLADLQLLDTTQLPDAQPDLTVPTKIPTRNLPRAIRQKQKELQRQERAKGKQKTQQTWTPTTPIGTSETLPHTPSAQQTRHVEQEVSQPQTPTKQSTNIDDQMAYQAQHFLLYDPTRSRSNSPEPQRQRSSRSVTPEPRRSIPQTPTKQQNKPQHDQEPMTPIKVKHIKK